MKRQNFLMLAAAALLASCSQDDALQSTVNNNEGLKPMTITASLPTDGMQTRAAGDADAARCYVQILDKDGNPLEDGNSEPIEMDSDGDTFTTLVYLNGNETYDFLFWADTELNGNETYDFLFWADTEADGTAAPADLQAVEYTNGQTIAWAGNDLDKQWSAEGINVTLSHVVSRVTVMTKSDFTVSDAWPLTVTVPTVYNKYNVATGAVVADSKVSGGYMLDVTDGEYEANAEVGHFYVLGDGSNQILALHYDGPLENPAIDINDVPVSANTHITLTGDIYHAGLVEGNIMATVSTDWGYEETEDFDGGSDPTLPEWGDGDDYYEEAH